MTDSEPKAGELARKGRTDGVGVYVGQEGPPATLRPLGESGESPVPTEDPRRSSPGETKR